MKDLQREFTFAGWADAEATMAGRDGGAGLEGVGFLETTGFCCCCSGSEPELPSKV